MKLYNNWDWDCYQVVIDNRQKLVSDLSEEEAKDQLCRLLSYLDEIQTGLSKVDFVIERCVDGE